MTTFTDFLTEYRSGKVGLCKLQPYDPGSSSVIALYYSTHGFTSKSSETPANQYYEARLKSGYQATWSLFSQGKLAGSSSPSDILIHLINDDGALDPLLGYAWGSRRVQLWLGGDDFALTDYGLVVDGVADNIEVSQQNEIIIHVRDAQKRFDREIQSVSFAGSGGAEGGTDVANKLKPMPWGVVRNARVIYLGADTGKHMFALADGAIIGVIRVRDLGLELTFNAGTPGAGEWTCDLAAGTITLGGAYNGPITVDVIGKRYLSATSSTSWTVGAGSKTFTVSAGLAIPVGAKLRVARTSALSSVWGDGAVTAYSGTSLTVNVTSTSGAVGPFTDWTISPWGTATGIMKAIATLMGVSSFDSTALTALDAAQSATVGYWIEAGGNGLQHLDAIANGISAYHRFDRSGNFSVARLTAPSSPVDIYTDLQVLEDSLERVTTDDPNYRVDVQGDRNWAGNMQSNELAGAVTDSDRAFLSNEWRTATSQDASVQTAYPDSAPIVVNSIFDETADMATEAARLLAMFKVKQDYFKIRTKLQPLARNLGDAITVTLGRYGLDSGRDFRIVDIFENTDPDTCEVQLGIWGGV